MCSLQRHPYRMCRQSSAWWVPSLGSLLELVSAKPSALVWVLVWALVWALVSDLALALVWALVSELR